MDGISLHRAVEHFTTAFPCPLRTMCGNLGVTKNILSTGFPGAAANDTDTCRNHDLLTVHSEGARQPLLNALRDANGIAGVAKLGSKHDKFVASRPCQGMVSGKAFRVSVQLSGNSVGATQACRQSTSYLNKKFVSQCATQTIVYHFELIDVDE